ncbi:ubiquitin carboxyl-terminal hydrolase 17-like protein 6 [Anomalospiza imberbis]|uniref:ubiquitin carboxyl-terminal hydrolase 17-like protein 6 n=1 Tax=Anomalospiza imberbis TaxID=187417 RepID=UPI00358FEF79
MATTENHFFIAEGLAPPKRILFPPEKICMVWQQRQSAGAGLFNVGNTCFLNAVLQCLTYTPPLANYLLSREHSRACHQQGFCMMCIMEAHINEVLHSPVSAILPLTVLKVFRCIGEHFQPGREEDAHDFLCCTVNAMQRACLSASNDLDLSSQSTTVVYQIFGGFLRSRVTCFSCEAISDSYEAFLDVPLDIKAASSLTAALEDFVTPEHLDGDNCFKCNKCKKNVAASKRFTVHCAPKILTVCLKRFDCLTGGKISKVVEYPEYLDLRPYMSQADAEPLHYSLYAVLVHSGVSCHEGHYFCYTKASNGLWYQMDDESVELCCIDTALRQQAYLLFYARCSDLKIGERASSSLAPPYAPSFLSQWASSSKQVASVGPEGLPGRMKVTLGRRVTWHQRSSGFLSRISAFSLLPFPPCSILHSHNAASSQSIPPRSIPFVHLWLYGLGSPPEEPLGGSEMSPPRTSGGSPLSLALSGEKGRNSPQPSLQDMALDMEDAGREQAWSRSPLWGRDGRSCFVDTTDCDHSAGKRVGPPSCDHAPRDGAASGPSSRSLQWTGAPRAAWDQTLLLQREMSRSVRGGYDLRGRFVHPSG